MSSKDEFVGSPEASKLFLVLFIIVSVLHFMVMVWKRSWFMIWFVVGGILEFSSFVQDPNGNGCDKVQSIIGPIFLAASVYLSLTRLLLSLDIKHFTPINTGLQSMLFIFTDIICLGLQVAGVVLQLILKKPIGKIIVIVGFTIQLLSFAAFITILLTVHIKLRKTDPAISNLEIYKWPGFIIMLYVVNGLFCVRNIFRLVEYSQGFNGYIFSHTLFAFILDITLMFIVMVLMLIVHPSFLFEKTAKKTRAALNRSEAKSLDPTTTAVE